MKSQILFSGENKKNISVHVCCLLKILPSMQSVNTSQFSFPLLQVSLPSMGSGQKCS